jgi:hypothetical protein
MAKKLLMGLAAVLVVAGGVAALSAYEAHVINVTAHIENALNVHDDEISFGTVFPQEYLERQFTVQLSDSFLAAGRVWDVNYKIVQKPKCICSEEGIKLEECDEGEYAPVDYATHECPEYFEEMENLCQFLSKLDADPKDNNDTGVPSYYVEDDPDYCQTPSSDIATGKLHKGIPDVIKSDIVDLWKVDLKVPPVDGYVGQDWPVGCPTVPTNDVDYGCDLWVEVTGISLPPR